MVSLRRNRARLDRPSRMRCINSTPDIVVAASLKRLTQRMIVVCASDSPRSAIISTRSRKLSLSRRELDWHFETDPETADLVLQCIPKHEYARIVLKIYKSGFLIG